MSSFDMSSPWKKCSKSGHQVLIRAVGIQRIELEGADNGEILETKTERYERIGDSEKAPIVVQKMRKSGSLLDKEPMEITRNGMIPFKSVHYDPKIKKDVLNQTHTEIVKIGEGGMGVVFRAKSLEDGLLYAVKKSTREQEAKNFLSIPPHTNILKFHEAWTDNGIVHIKTELCQKDLSMNQNEKRIWTIFLELLSGLSHLHSNGWIHNDLKSENILISMDGRLRIGDMGLATRSGEGKAVDGDGRYIALEVLGNRCTKASDVFSLGIILLELSTNIFLPNSGSTWRDIRNSKIPERFFDGVDEELRELMIQMIHSNPDARPTCEELIEHPIVKEKLKNIHISDFFPTTEGSFRGPLLMKRIPKMSSDISPPNKIQRIEGTSTPVRTTRRLSLRDRGIRIRDFGDSGENLSSTSNIASFRSNQNIPDSIRSLPTLPDIQRTPGNGSNREEESVDPEEEKTSFKSPRVSKTPTRSRKNPTPSGTPKTPKRN
uniref:non-specific serine/threonine protein kinase n=1 Tax=Caenorhabditis tropicalis TaxID=1561998 RepID=A0A1I7TTX3_9PELO